MLRPLRPQPPILSRRLLLPALAGLALASLPVLIPGAVPPAMAQSVTIEIGQFEPALSPYGRWFDHPAYGRIWQPGGIGPNWQPYTDGYWAYMADDTWLWVANEPWGWAPYHYGRWLFVEPIGWVWRPGRVWAPAWVVWRYGGGYYGWAPAPFDDDWDERQFRGSNWGNRVPAQHWIFVRSGAFTHHHIREVMVPRHSNHRLYGETQDITRTGHRRRDNADGRDREANGDEGGGRRHTDVVIQGPRERDIRRETGRPIPPARVVDSDAPGPATRSGNEVRLYRPDHRGRNGEGQRGGQPREQPGSATSPGQPDAMPPVAGRPDGARPDGGQPRRPEAGQPPGEEQAGRQKPGKADEPPARPQIPAQPQKGDRRGGEMAPVLPTRPTEPRVPQVAVPDQPEASQPEFRRPDVAMPEVRKPEVRRPDVRQPESLQPRPQQPEVRRPERNETRQQEPQRMVPDVRPAPPYQGRMPDARAVVTQQPQIPSQRSGQGADFQSPGQRQRQQQDMQPQRQRQQQEMQPQRQQPQRQQGQQGRPQKGGRPGDAPPMGDNGN